MSASQGIPGGLSVSNIQEESSIKKEAKVSVADVVEPNLHERTSPLPVLSLATASVSLALLASGLGMLIHGSLYQNSYSSHLQIAGYATEGVGTVGAIAAIVMMTRAALKRIAGSQVNDTQTTKAAKTSDRELTSADEPEVRDKEQELKLLISQRINFERYGLFKFSDEKSIGKLQTDLKSIVTCLIESQPLNILHEQTKDALLQDFFKLFNDLKSEEINKKVIEHMQQVLLMKCQDFKAYVEEIKTHVEKDFSVLKETFGLTEKSRDSFQIQLLSGETHNRGKKVCLIAFEDKIIVYKPRSIRLDNRFCGIDPTSLFSQINASMKNSSIKLPTYTMLKMGNYGYTEYLSHEKKDRTFSEQQLKMYYQTLGALEAIAQIFGIQDLHAENLLVHKHLPFLIDLEVALCIKSLIYSHGNKDTNLYEAHTGGEKEGISRVKVDEANSLVSIKFVKEGFETVKFWMINHKKDLIRMALYFAKGVKSRYIPAETRKFTESILMYFKNIDRIDEEILPVIKQNFFFKLIHYAKLEGLTLQQLMDLSQPDKQTKSSIPGKIELPDAMVKALTEAFLEDLKHCDVPIMYCDSDGKVRYKDVEIMDLSSFDTSDLVYDEAGLPALSLIQKLLVINIQTVENLTWNDKGWKEIDFLASDNITEPYSSSLSEENGSENSLSGEIVPDNEERSELHPPRFKRKQGSSQATSSSSNDESLIERS